MEIFLTTNNRGHGVRAARPIARGEFVVEYAGGREAASARPCFWGDGVLQVPFSELLTVCALRNFFLTFASPNPSTSNPQTPTPNIKHRPGEVIDGDEMRRRMDEQRVRGQHHFYIMELGPGLFIDALRRGNNARLLNSSCEPNCETQKW